MTESEKKMEWCRFVKASQSSYRLNALKAVFKNDGEVMLGNVLKELGWERSLDLIKNAEPPELIQ